MITASPTEQDERAVIVDIIRGFALMGVLIANFTAYNYQNLPSNVIDTISSPLDKALINFNTVFFEWKFMTIFSILFGYGFGLIILSIEKKGINPTIFFIRRMFWLFIIGIIHTLFWWGDVLHFYALSGLLLLPFRKFPVRRILIFSILFMFVIPPLISYLFRDQPDYFTDQHLQDLYEQYKYGNVADVFKANVNLYYKAFIITGGDIHDIIETLGRFLFGYFLVRIRLFDSIKTKKHIFNKVLVIAAPIVVFYLILRWQSLKGTVNTDKIYWEPIIKTGIIFTSCFYVSVLVLLFIRFGQTKFFSAMQALGKMTLTNYLLISAILITILYRIGFGQLGILTMHLTWICAFVWLIVEIAFSSYWLGKFRFGPSEWIWRQLTYNKRIQLRK